MSGQSFRTPFLAALALAAALGGCGAPSSEERLPEGTLLVGRAGGFAEFLAQCQKLSGTPLARTAGVLRARIASCDRFAAFCPAGETCSLADRLACGPGGPELAPARDLLDDASWLVSTTFATGRATLRGWPLARGGQRMEVDLELHRDGGDRGGLSLLLPSAKGPGPPRLAGDAALVHLRVRPDAGLDVASLIPADSMAARLFRLKSELFVATALAGDWEVAVYLPRPGQLIPPVAMAIDTARRDQAVEAMEAFLTQVGQTWPIDRVPYRAGEFSGACLSDLKVMPELSPCYVATERALVLGWNPGSIELALGGAGVKATAPTAAGSGTPAPALAGEASSLVVDLTLFPEADRRLAAASGAANDRPATEYPWRSLTATGSRVGEIYRIEGELAGW